MSRLSAVMVVQLGLSCLRDGELSWRRLSLRRIHSSRLSRLRRESRQRRQSRHHSFTALVAPVPR